MDLCDRSTIQALLGRHGFRFSKSMGQNFLIQGWVPDGLVEGAGVSRENGVLEVGPGIGPLTVRLARAASKVVAVELDRALLPVLAETLAGLDNVEVRAGDILKLDIGALVDETFPGLTPMACANLPYNITTPVLTALIESGRFARITVMIQREVARRICAAPGAQDYGAFSVYCQFHTVPEPLFDVGPECFVPAPKVTSSSTPSPPAWAAWTRRPSAPPSPPAACPKPFGGSGWASRSSPSSPPPWAPFESNGIAESRRGFRSFAEARLCHRFVT